MGQNSRIRILLSKSALDGHDRGIRVIAKALRDQGMEVIYTQFKLPEDIVAVAIQENVDIIGISFATGGQVKVTQNVMRLLKEKGMEDVPVIVGGTIRPFDFQALNDAGVRGIFRGGDSLDKIFKDISQILCR